MLVISCFNIFPVFSSLILQCFILVIYFLEKENLCLYGHPNETWEVNLPAEEVPPELPEPALGINFARDGMNRRDWLSLIAVHSDCWLLSVAFYLGARLNRNERYMHFILCALENHILYVLNQSMMIVLILLLTFT